MFAPPPLPRTLEATFRDLASETEKVRVSALQDLGRHLLDEDARSCRARGIAALEKALSDEAAKVREIAAIVAGETSSVELVPSLLVALEDPHSMVRQMAMDALGRLGDKRALPRIERALTDERPEIRYQAIIAIGKLSPENAQAVALRIVDDDAHVRYIALRVAEESGLGEEPVVQVAAEKMLSDADAKVRVAAALLLAPFNLGHAQKIVADVVRGDLRTPEAEDEQAAVEASGALGMTDVTRDLERRAWGLFRFAKETYPWHAKIALAALAHPRALSELMSDLSSSRREVREAAMVALGRARVTSSIERIRNLDDDVDEKLRDEALHNLRHGKAR